MAISQTMSTDNDYIKYNIEVIQNSQNISGNYSNVRVRVKFWRTNTGYSTYGTGTVYCIINGVTYSASVYTSQKITSSGIYLFDRTVNITHNADGAKSLTCSAKITHNRVNSSYQSFTTPLTTIPRATTPVASNTAPYIGSTITITLPRASASFSHSMRYRCGSLNVLFVTGAATSWNLTIPDTIYVQTPNSASVAMYIDCYTYQSSTLIGTKTIAITAKVPENVIPSISAHEILENKPDIATKFGVFIEDKSEIKVKTTAVGANYSTIARIETTVQGMQFVGEEVVFPVSGSGSVDIVTKVIDSRGRSATITKSIIVSYYNSPTISDFTVFRCDSSGIQSDTGTRLRLSLAFDISSLGNKNDKTYKVEYSTDGNNWTVLRGATTTTGAATNIAGSVYYLNSVLYSDPQQLIDVAYSYQVRITITDYFSNASWLIQIPVGRTLLSFRYNKKGMAIGKQCEADGLEVAMPLNLQGIGDLATAINSIVQRGDNDKGEWVKFRDGTMICWFNSTAYTSIASPYGSLFVGAFYVEFPQSFIAEPTVALGRVQWTTGASWGAVMSAEKNRALIRIIDALARASGSIYYQYIAIGRWKN